MLISGRVDLSFVGTVTQQVVVDNRRQINVLLAGDGRHSHHSGGSKTAEGRRTWSMKLFFMDCQLYFYKFNPPVSKPIRKLTSFATFLNITMMRFCLPIATLLFCTAATAQRYDASAIFAHNDYARAVPFYEAYDLEVGYIEADVFLVDSKIVVAHDKHEIRPERDLETLYLIPLLQKVRQNHGHVYDDHARTLTLMIDL